jgi:hypothetical protein
MVRAHLCRPSLTASQSENAGGQAAKIRALLFSSPGFVPKHTLDTTKQEIVTGRKEPIMKIPSMSTPVATSNIQEKLSQEQLAAVARAREAEAADSRITFDNSARDTTERVMSGKELQEFEYRLGVYHRDLPLVESDKAINAIEAQLAKVQKSIASDRPDLARASWDMTVVDGKLSVTGSMNSADKEWLQNKLNGNGTLTAAVTSYMKAAVDYLETMPDNPRHGGQSPISGQLVDYNFKDVRGQLEGKIAFKELIAATWKKYDFGSETKVDPGNYRGGDSLEMLALRLTVRM